MRVDPDPLASFRLWDLKAPGRRQSGSPFLIALFWTELSTAERRRHYGLVPGDPRFRWACEQVSPVVVPRDFPMDTKHIYKSHYGAPYKAALFEDGVRYSEEDAWFCALKQFLKSGAVQQDFV